MPLLELNQVSKSYQQGRFLGPGRKIKALDAVSLKLEAGRCLALLGPSASGKSTLGRLVLGLERPDSGQILYQGKDYFSLQGQEKREARRKIQVVFQNSQGAVNPRFKAVDIVGEPLGYFFKLNKAQRRERAASLLFQVGLDPKMLDRLPHQFSGGELQRLCLARALAPEPELIVLDEALSALDMLNQSLILDLLAQIKASSGLAFLFISHDLRLVSKVADSLAILKDGRLNGYAQNLEDQAQVAAFKASPAFQALAQSVLAPGPC